MGSSSNQVETPTSRDIMTKMVSEPVREERVEGEDGATSFDQARKPASAQRTSLPSTRAEQEGSGLADT